MITKEGKSKKSFWDILAWIAYVIFFTYLFLKALGVLNSPPIADIIAFASVAFFIGRYAQKIDSIEKILEYHIKDKRAHKY